VYNSMASMANLASFQSMVKFFWVSKICDGSVLGLQVLRVWLDINLRSCRPFFWRSPLLTRVSSNHRIKSYTIAFLDVPSYLKHPFKNIPSSSFLLFFIRHSLSFGHADSSHRARFAREARQHMWRICRPNPCRAAQRQRTLFRRPRLNSNPALRAARKERWPAQHHEQLFVDIHFKYQTNPLSSLVAPFLQACSSPSNESSPSAPSLCPFSCQRDLDIIPLSLGFDEENFEATSKRSCTDLK
jgi:hypothetical protein